MPNALTHPRSLPQYGRDGRPAWYVVEAPDGTRIDLPCGLSIIAGRLDTEDGTPGQLMVHINTENVGEADSYDGGMTKIVVSVNDGEVYDDQGAGNVAEPIDAMAYVVHSTDDGPYVFADRDQAQAYCDLGGHQIGSARVWNSHEGAQRLRDLREDAGLDNDGEQVAA